MHGDEWQRSILIATAHATDILLHPLPLWLSL